ncbi:alkaline phosphatase [Phyllobacterium myrsinacearum]|uniref:DedA family protein n=1 Tax=Phyllobacterium myrsinacearum TaxID=28101 RepID=UPI0010F41EB6|nr:DedA family protein [Phyllobacterium myrsinacearum]RZS77637.1 alkaline phosphatase [Phyllobacterium myrsinacearum]
MDSPLYASLLDMGLLGIVVLAFAEKLIPVLPSYLMLVFLGATYVSDVPDLIVLVLATVCGSTLGALFWYGIGRLAGKERTDALAARFGRYIFLPVTRYRAMANAYETNQFWVTLVAQTIPTIRIFLAMPAGVLRLKLQGFLPATILGIFVWNTPLVGLGFLLRQSERDPLQMGVTVVGAILLGELAVGLIFRRVRG